MSHTVRTFFFLAMFLFALLPRPAIAAGITIAVSEWPPYFSLKHPDQNYAGDILTEALKAVDITLHFKVVPWPRASFMVKKGRVAAAFPWKHSAAKESYARFSQPVMTLEDVFFYHDEHICVGRDKGVYTFQGHAGGGVTGFDYVKMFRRAGVVLKMFPDEQAMITNLANNNIDYIVGERMRTSMLLKNSYPKFAPSVCSTQHPLSEKPLHLMVSKDHPQGDMLLEAFRKGYAIIKDNGTLEAIDTRYGIM